MFLNGINGSERVRRIWKITTVPITFFEIKYTVHFEFIPQGQTVNQVYYVEIWKWLHEAAHRKRPKFWPSN
jgi:hypothetical protein